MNTDKKKSVLFPIILLAAFSLTCSDSQATLDRELLARNLARVHINLELPGDVEKVSFIDRVLRIFSTEAVAQTAPAVFDTISVTVAGPGMAPVNATYPAGPLITVLVPAGASRLFDITAFVADFDSSAALSFRGTALANLTAGATVPLPITMGLNETKIVLPDFVNNRIIQMDDIAGTNFKTKLVDGFTTLPAGVTEIYPFDIAFDNRGRIYFASYSSSTDTGIFRIDNINSTTLERIAGGSVLSILAIAIDKVNRKIYFANSSELYSCNYDGSSQTQITPLSVTLIYGLGINEQTGNIYIAGNISGSLRIGENIPGTDTIVNSYTITSGQPQDVLHKHPYVYVVSYFSFTVGTTLLKLDSSLNLIQGYGTNTGTVNTDPGMFYDPRRFVAIRNDTIIILDDDGGVNIDKVISLNDIDGSGWKTFPSSGDGQSYFQFFYFC